jgi:Domain of unknown function (DUF1844)
MSSEKASKTSEGVRELPNVDFSTFVLSLATAALYELGAVPDARSGELPPADPMVARQTLETLEMLREKTLGNLTEDERKLIDSLLYDLRMRFVELER